MKNQKYKDYVAAGLTGFVMIAASITIFFIYYKLSFFLKCLKGVVSILAPFLVGLVIAYLLAPLYNLLMRNLRAALERCMKVKTAKSIATLVSVLACIVAALLILGGLVALVLPRFTESIMGIVNALPGYLQRLNLWIEGFFIDNPDIYQQVTESLDQLSDSVLDWASSDLLPMLEGLTMESLLDKLGGVGSAVGVLFSGVMVAVDVVKNVVLGVIVAVYVLIEKNRMLGQCKQITYAVFGPKLGNRVVKRLRFTNTVLGGFIRGKLLDSLIIGMICFIGTSLMRMPYPTLLSVIVGVTNIIPFFGPIIGAVPCVLLILMHSPIQAVYFCIFILILQQFDGNILGPKILGNTTGLSSFWVLFSILLFGGLFGFVGMLIGVPLFAVIYSVISDVIHMKLNKRSLSTKAEDYVNLDLVRQEKDGSYSYGKLKNPEKKG